MSRLLHVAMTLTQLWHRVPGGTATSMVRLARSIDRTGRVDLSAVGARGEIRRPASMCDPVGALATPPPVPMRSLPIPLPLLYDSWTRTGRPGIAAGDTSVDVVHLTVPVSPPRDAVPLVATVHDVFPLTHPELMSARGVALMARGLRAIARRADRVLVATRYVADECIRLGFDPARMEIIPFGVDPVAVTDADVRRVRVKYGIRGPYVLFVGTFEPRKNVGLLLDAMVRVNDPDLSLVLVGPDGWQQRASGPRSARVSEVPSPVLRPGFIPPEDLTALQHGSAAFCYPSLVEGFGLPVLEAMAAGSVVITSGVGATAEVAGDGAILVDPGDSRQLADAIRAVRADDTMSGDLRRAGLERARQFSWDTAARATCDVYEAVSK